MATISEMSSTSYNFWCVLCF